MTVTIRSCGLGCRASRAAWKAASVPADHGAHEAFDAVAVAGEPGPHAGELYARLGAEPVAEVEPQVPIRHVRVRVVRAAEGHVDGVDRAAQRGQVLAAPVQQHVAVDQAVAGGKLDLLSARQRHVRVAQELPHLRVGLRTGVAARYHPEDGVVVQGDVPLQHGRPVAHEGALDALDRRLTDGVHVPVPVGVAVVDDRAAEHLHLRDQRLGLHQPAADPQGVLAQQELDRGRGGRLHREIQAQARLPRGLPVAAGRIIGGALFRPHELLPLQRRLEIPAGLREPVGRNDPLQMQEALLHEAVTVDVHGRDDRHRGRSASTEPLRIRVEATLTEVTMRGDVSRGRR